MKYFALNTKRLLLETAPVNNSSIQEMVSWLNNPDIVRYSEQRHKKHTIESQYQYIRSFQDDNLLLAIYLKSVMIGTISTYIDTQNRVANIGIMIGDISQHGKGYGYEAWEGVCNALFERDIRKIEAGCMDTNRAMIRLCLHYGMIEEGRQDDHFILHKSPLTTCDLINWGKIK